MLALLAQPANDLLLLMKATKAAGLKARFGTIFLDQPGNIANAGDTGLGHYTQSTFFPDANGDKTAKFAEDFKGQKKDAVADEAWRKGTSRHRSVRLLKWLMARPGLNFPLP